MCLWIHNHQSQTASPEMKDTGTSSVEVPVAIDEIQPPLQWGSVYIVLVSESDGNAITMSGQHTTIVVECVGGLEWSSWMCQMNRVPLWSSPSWIRRSSSPRRRGRNQTFSALRRYTIGMGRERTSVCFYSAGASPRHWIHLTRILKHRLEMEYTTNQRCKPQKHDTYILIIVHHQMVQRARALSVG